MFCAPFCQNSWIADNYCDDACNVKSCGYDAGDCGIKNFEENLFKVPFIFNSSVKDWNFKIPDGKTVAYWDMTKVFDQYVEIGIIPTVNHKGLQDKSPLIIRAISFSDSHKVLTLVLYENVGPTSLNVEIRKNIGNTEDSEVIHNFFIHINTKNSTIAFNTDEKEKETNGSYKIDPTSKIELPQIKSSGLVTEKATSSIKFQNNASNLHLPKDSDINIKAKENIKLSANEVGEAKDIKHSHSIIGENVKIAESINNVEATPAENLVKVDSIAESSGIHPDNRIDPLQNKAHVKEDTNMRTKDGFLVDKSENDEKTKNSAGDQVIHEKVNATKAESHLIVANESLNLIDGQLKSNATLHLQINKEGVVDPEPNFKEEIQIPKGVVDKDSNRNTTQTKIEIVPKLHPIQMENMPQGNDNINKPPLMQQNVLPAHQENGIKNKKDHDNKTFMQQNKESVQNISGNTKRKLLSLDNKNVGDGTHDYIDDNDIDHGIVSDKSINDGTETWKNPALDIYGNSLLFTNRQFDIVYGHNSRKVIAHMPHLIDLDIINLMFQKFPSQWATTSSHKLRSAEDMQFEFSYFHFLISEKLRFNVENVFDEFDTDQSKSWSDREIRTLLTRIYSLPLMASQVLDFEELITGCMSNSSISKTLPQPIVSDYPPFERYYDSKLPTIVTKELITGTLLLRNIWQIIREFLVK